MKQVEEKNVFDGHSILDKKKFSNIYLDQFQSKNQGLFFYR